MLPNGKMIVRMTLEKQTPGALRYQEIGEDGQPVKQTNPACVLGTLYIRKTGMGNAMPKNISVTIDPAEET